MHINLPGQHTPRPTALAPSVLQLGLAVAILAVAVWAYFHAPTVRATDQWAYNFLAAVAGLFGLLWLPFALVALGKTLRNRRTAC